MSGSRHVARTCLVVDWEVDELDSGHRSAVGGTGRWCIRVGECNTLGYGGETGTVGFSVDRGAMGDGRHVARTCLVADWEVDELDFGHRSAVGGTGRRCIRVGECDQLSYGGETGTIGFSVERRVMEGSRQVARGCLVADQGDDQC